MERKDISSEEKRFSQYFFTHYQARTNRLKKMSLNSFLKIYASGYRCMKKLNNLPML